VLYLIDGSSQMYRAFHAPVRTAEGGFLRNAQGRPTNALYIFDTMLRKLLTYLRLANCPVGLVINFNVPVLKDGVKRVLNPAALLRARGGADLAVSDENLQCE
jgi:5'-3' exonuclease